MPNVLFLNINADKLRYKIQTQKLPNIEKANQNIELEINFLSLISLKNVKAGAKHTPTRMRNMTNPSMSVAKNLFALKTVLFIK